MTEGKQNTGTKVSPLSDDYCFMLRRKDNNCPPFVQVNFSPTPDAQPASETPAPSLIHPVFNHDRYHFTPSFILPVEQLKTLRHLDTYLKLHEERVVEMSQEREQLLVPKPSRSNSYCCICKVLFEDYLTHVNIPSHQQLLRGSSFHGQIEALSRQFNPPMAAPEKAKKPGKTQRIKKLGKKGKESAKLNACHSSSTMCQENIFSQEKAQQL